MPLGAKKIQSVMVCRSVPIESQPQSQSENSMKKMKILQTRSAILLHAHSTPSCKWSGLSRHDQATVVVCDGPDAQTRDHSRADAQIQSLVCATSSLVYFKSECWDLQASHLQCLHMASKNCFSNYRPMRTHRPMRTLFQRFPTPCTRDSLLLL